MLNLFERWVSTMLKSNLIEIEQIQSLSDQFLKVSQVAAIATFPWIGKGNKNEADGAATKSMRDAMGIIDMNARIVIGEGEMDAAPMLYIGEMLGTGDGPYVDVAV